MIIVILTRSGFDEAKSSIIQGKVIAWVNGDVLDPDEINQLRAGGADVTNFTYPIDPNDSEAIQDALAIISEHHPDRAIWIETGGEN